MNKFDEHAGSRAATRDFISCSRALSDFSLEDKMLGQLSAYHSYGVSAAAQRIAQSIKEWASTSILAGFSPTEAWFLASISSPREIASVDDEVDRIREALSDDPLEDGRHHQAEDMLRTIVTARGADVLPVLLGAISTGDTETQGALIQCIGRLDPETVLPWGLDVARKGLLNRSMRVRGAAIKAIELWGTDASLALLHEHDEPVKWLADHVRKLLARKG